MKHYIIRSEEKTYYTRALNVKDAIKRIKVKDFDRNTTFEEYKESGKFRLSQLDEIHLGLLSGVDVSKYAKPEYTWEKMQKIRWELEKGTYKD